MNIGLRHTFSDVGGGRGDAMRERMKCFRRAAAALSVLSSMAAVGWARDGQPPATSPTPPASVAPSPAPSPATRAPARRRAVDDKRRTMKSYGSNLAYNALGVFTPGNHRPLLVTAALAAPAFAWDSDGIAYFDRHPHQDMGEIGRSMGGGLAVGGLTIGFFSAGRIHRGERFRAATYDVSQAILVNGFYTFALKAAVGRERPDHSDHNSFPSGHASSAFAWATTIVRHYPRLAIPVYGLASFIAVSRMAANKHHLSDVVAGAGFGFGVGRLVVRRNGRPPDAAKGPPAEPARSLTWRPDAGPSGDGAGLVFSFTF